MQKRYSESRRHYDYYQAKINMGKKMTYSVQFMMHDFDYVDENFFMICWEEKITTDNIEDAIKLGYEVLKEKEYKYFIITEDGNLDNFFYDSKIEDEKRGRDKDNDRY